MQEQQDKDEHPIDNDMDVDNGLSYNDGSQTATLFKKRGNFLGLKTRMPNNLDSFGSNGDFNNDDDEPKPNLKLHMIADNEDEENEQKSKFFKLAKKQHSQDSSDDDKSQGLFSKSNQLQKKKQQQVEEEERRQLALYVRCKKATQDHVKKYCFGFHPSVESNQRYVNIEGPNPDLDFSFFAVNMDTNFKDFERGMSIIPPAMFNQKFNGNMSKQTEINESDLEQQDPSQINTTENIQQNNESQIIQDKPMDGEQSSEGILSKHFGKQVEERLQDIRAEFIILQKVTFHEDHAKHLIYLRLTDDPKAGETVVCQIDEIQMQNRHMTCLPYNHSQVKLVPLEELVKKNQKDASQSNSGVENPEVDQNKSTDQISNVAITSTIVNALSPTPSAHHQKQHSKECMMHAQQKYVNEYINANYISGMIRNFSEKSIIAAMAPTENTLCKFWRMIWQNEVNLVIMLCPFMKDDKKESREESINYWNQDMHCQELEQVGQITKIYNSKQQEIFQLKLLEITEVRTKIYLRKIQVNFVYKNQQDKKEDNQSPYFPGSDDLGDSRIIDHIHHVGWIDDTAPQSDWLYEDIDYLVDLMDKSRNLNQRIEEAAKIVDDSSPYTQEKPKQITKASPILIHCSAGIGRTGTLVGIYNIVESLKYQMNASNFSYIMKAKNNQWIEEQRNVIASSKDAPQSLCPLRVSVFGCIRKIREQRMNMVKTKDQYNFVYKYLQRWVTKHEQELGTMFT